MEAGLRAILIGEDREERSLVINELRQSFTKIIITQVDSRRDFEAVLDNAGFDLAITDEQLSWSDGLSILRTLKSRNPECPVIMLMPPGQEDAAIEAIKAGLDDCLFTEPGHIARLGAMVRIAMERRRQRQALRASEARYLNLVENINDFLWEINQKGIFTYISPKVSDILGYNPVEIIGKSVKELKIEEQYKEALPFFSKNGGKAHSPVLIESLIHHRDGRLVILETSATPIPGEDGKTNGYRGVCRDVTERIKVKDALHRREAILEAVSLATGHLLDSSNWDENIHSMLDKMGDAAGVSRAYLFENRIVENGIPLSGLLTEWISSSTPRSKPHSRSKNTPPPILRFPDVNALLAERQAVSRLLGDFPEAERKVLGEQGVLSILLVPIFIADEWWGIIGLEDWSQEQEWPLMDVEAVEIAAGILGAAIQRRRTQDALTSAENQFRTLVERALVGIYVLDEQGKFLYVNPRLAEISGYPPEDLVRSLTIFDLCPDLKADILDQYKKDPQPQPIHRILRARVRNGSLIDIEVEGSRIELDGKPAIIGTLLEVTERETRQREMQVIISLSTAMRAATYRNEMLPIILNQLIKLFNVDGASVVTQNPISGELLIEAARGAWEGLAGKSMQPGDGVSGAVIASNQPYLNNDFLCDPQRAQLGGGADLPCAACVPLIAQQQTIGTLWLGSRKEFSQDDLSLLMAVSEIAANAIHRATLFEQTELRLQRLTALRAIDMAITASLDVRVTLNILLGQVTSQLGIHAASVLLLNHFTQTLEYTAGRGFRSAAIQHHRLRLGEGSAGKAAVERQPVSIPDLRLAEGVQKVSDLAGEEFVAYYAIPLIAKGQVKGVMELYHREAMTTDHEWLDFLQAVAAQAAIAIDNAELFDKLQRSNIELTLAYDATIEGWSHALELRDRASEGHIQRVGEQTIQLGRALGVPEAELVHMRRGVLLHDIGHMAIPDSILFKKGPLTDEEWEIMRRHPLYAYELLSPIPYLRPALDIPYCHHEWWDGSGYPRGLKQTQIPLAARIFSVIDVWDALHSERPYRSAWPDEKACGHLRSLAGKQFDPQVADIFLNVIVANETLS
jgi:PAS domain S-box-containing protein